MAFSDTIRDRVLVESARHCCVCTRHRGVKVEVHHIIPESISKDNTYENAIALCFDCHYEAGHYNDKHPKGTKFSPGELKKHKERWNKTVQENKIELAGEENNLLHVQFYACMSLEIAREICSKNMGKFPVKDVMLYQNKVFDYQCDLLKNLTVYFYRNFKKYSSEKDYLDQNPHAIKGDEAYPCFSYSRDFSQEKDGQLITQEEKTVFDKYIRGGLHYKDFVTLTAYHPCGCGDGEVNTEEMIETMKICKPYFFYLSITNLHSSSIRLENLDYSEHLSKTDHTDFFPPMLLNPGTSVVIPLGQFLEHPLEDYSYEEYGNMPPSERMLVSYTQEDYKKMLFFGNSIIPNVIRYKFGNSFFEFRPHEFDRNKVFYLDWAWMIGSCPHCFLKNNEGTYSYYGELLGNGEDKDATSEILFAEEFDEVIIAEIEDETTHISCIELNDSILVRDLILFKGDSFCIPTVKAGDVLRIQGSYHPFGKTQRNVEALYSRNDRVFSYLNALTQSRKMASS